MENLQQEGYLKDVDVKCVFHNIADVYRSNVRFWRIAIQPMLEEARASAHELNSAHLTPGFSNITEWCHAYIQFNLEFTHIHFYVQKKQKENEVFREFVLVSI